MFALAILTACDGSEPPPTEEIPEFASIHAGAGYTCGLTADGAALCWGTSDLGRFGDGEPGGNLFYSPIPAASGTRFAALSLGFEHACGIGLDDVAYCWGQNRDGALGTGDEINTARNTPTPVQGGLQLVQVSAGFFHTCGLTAAGAAHCWGNNDVGQLGTGNQDSQLLPAAVLGELEFQRVSTRMGSTVQVEQNSCGLRPDGAAWCWGGNQGGALGSGSDEVWSFTPVPVTGGHTFTQLEASGGYVCGITPVADLYCWGRNDLEPTLVAGGLPWTKVSLGSGHACGLLVTGLIYCWGANEWGQVGIGRGTPQFVAEPTRRRHLVLGLRRARRAGHR